MAVVAEEAFNGGTDGGALTATTAPGLASVTGGTWTHDATTKAEGTRSAKVVFGATASTAAAVTDSFTGTNKVFTRCYLQLSGTLPDAFLVVARSSTGTDLAGFTCNNATTELRIWNRTTDVTPAAGGPVLAANTWYRVEWEIDGGTSTQRLRVYSGANLHGTTPDVAQISGAFTSATATALAIGQTDVAASNRSIRFDALKADDAVQPGPVATAPTITAAVALTASATLTASTAPVVPAAAALTATATLTAPATVGPGVTLTASTALTVTAYAERFAAALLAADATLTTVGTVRGQAILPVGAWPRHSVRLITATQDRHVNADLTDASWRSVAIGGYASATIPLAAPIHLEPDELAMFARVVIYDTRTGAVSWEGYLEDPGRSAGDNGQVWELTAIGPSSHATDYARQYVSVDRAFSRFVRRGTSTRMATDQLVDYSGPTQTGEPAMQLQFPSGTPLVSTSALVMEYWLISDAGQKIGRFNYQHIEGAATSATLRVKSGVRVVIGQNVFFVRDDAFSATETGQLFRVAGTDFGLDDRLVSLRIAYDPSRVAGEVSPRIIGDDLAWAEITNFYVAAQRFRRDGTVQIPTTDRVFAHEVVTDVLVRFCPRFDAATAVVEAGTYPIEQLAYEEPVNAHAIFEDLAALEPGVLWQAWETLPSGKHRFVWRYWPSTVRYEADVSGGYSSRGSAAEIFNQVIVRWKDSTGRLRVTVRTQFVQALADAGRDRVGYVDLSNEAGDEINAIQAGDRFLAEHRYAPNAGSLTVAAPIVDHVSGRMVEPWEILPGELIRLHGVAARVDSLNATERDGLTVMRIIATDYSSGSGEASLELDAHPPGVARALADRLAGQRKRA